MELSDAQFWRCLVKLSFDGGWWSSVLTVVGEAQFWQWLVKLSFDSGWWSSVLTVVGEAQFWQWLVKLNFDSGWWSSVLTVVGDYEWSNLVSNSSQWLPNLNISKLFVTFCTFSNNCWGGPEIFLTSPNDIIVWYFGSVVEVITNNSTSEQFNLEPDTISPVYDDQLCSLTNDVKTVFSYFPCEMLVYCSHLWQLFWSLSYEILCHYQVILGYY